MNRNERKRKKKSATLHNVSRCFSLLLHTLASKRRETKLLLFIQLHWMFFHESLCFFQFFFGSHFFLLFQFFVHDLLRKFIRLCKNFSLFWLPKTLSTYLRSLRMKLRGASMLCDKYITHNERLLMQIRIQSTIRWMLMIMKLFSMKSKSWIKNSSSACQAIHVVCNVVCSMSSAQCARVLDNDIMLEHCWNIRNVCYASAWFLLIFLSCNILT